MQVVGEHEVARAGGSADIHKLKVMLRVCGLAVVDTPMRRPTVSAGGKPVYRRALGAPPAELVSRIGLPRMRFR